MKKRLSHGSPFFIFIILFVESEKFMFQLTKEEWDSLRFQIGILDVGWETKEEKYTKPWRN